MFTKKVLVLAVAGVLSSLAYAEPSVTLYGTADGGLVYQHVKNTGEKGTDTLALESGINDTTKWGLKGSEDLGNGTKVSFKLENGYNLDDGTLGNNNRLFGREAQVNISGNLGTLAFGRMGAIGSSAGTFDLTQYYAESFDGGDWSTFGMTMTDRYDNMLTYQTPSYGGFQATLQYSFKNDSKEDGDEGHSSANRFAGIGLTYEVGKLQTVFSYEWLDRSNLASNVNTKDGHIVSLGGNYDFGTFKLFALAKYVTGVDSFASFDNTELGDVSFSSTGSVLHNHGMKGYNLHVGSIVPIAGGDLTLGAYYADGKLTDTAASDSAASSSADLSYIGVAVKYAYHLSKRTDFYVGADFSQAKASSIKFEGADEGSLKYRTTSVYSGMTHYF